MSNLPDINTNEPNEEQNQWMREHKFPTIKHKKNSNKDEDEDRNKILKRDYEIAYKYSNKGKGELRESILLEGKATFIKYGIIEKNNKIKHFIKLEPTIEQQTRIIRPPFLEECPYEPYEFTDLGEPQYYLNRAIDETIDSIYFQIKKIISKFNDVDSNSVVLLSAYTLGSYFQDRFSTVHYILVIGDNGTGKSAIGDTFESLGYRAVTMTDATPANWYRVLGSVEHGQVTIIAEEADNIAESIEVMSILKTGYQPKGKVFRMDSDNKKQHFYYPYCMKMIISERSPGESKAKGLLDRSFKIKTYKGIPKYDIKEIRNPQGNKDRQEQQNDINNLRRLLIMFKIVHFKDPLPEVDTGLDGRDKELCKPILQLFCGLGAKADTIREIEAALQYFLDIKNQRKKNSLEAMLYPIIIDTISRLGNEIETGEIWNSLVSSFNGSSDSSNPNIFHSSDFGNIYRNSITKMICDKFGAENKHKEYGNVFVFNNDVYKAKKHYGESRRIITRAASDATETTDALSGSNPIPNSGSQPKFTTNHNNSHNFSDKLDILNSKIQTGAVQKFTNNPQDESCESV